MVVAQAPRCVTIGCCDGDYYLAITKAVSAEEMNCSVDEVKRRLQCRGLVSASYNPLTKYLIESMHQNLWRPKLPDGNEETGIDKIVFLVTKLYYTQFLKYNLDPQIKKYGLEEIWCPHSRGIDFDDWVAIVVRNKVQVASGKL
jgi:hypothetical protein